jgi:NitT/TauT family transport system ATP-binding protein
VVVMTYRPGRVKRIVPVALPRPRDTASPEFNALKREVTRLVMEEQARHEEAERGAAAG